MWLINTTTLELHDFIDANVAPPYAILSHCWGKDEVSFKDFRKKRNCIGSGYEKIVNCCRYAREHGYDGKSLEWAWVDTWYDCCAIRLVIALIGHSCIDKRSSAELSEAINSMFAWYQRAAICYALLSDVVIHEEPDMVREDLKITDNDELTKRVTKSRWFSRGWSMCEAYETSLAHHDLLRRARTNLITFPAGSTAGTSGASPGTLP